MQWISYALSAGNGAAGYPERAGQPRGGPSWRARFRADFRLAIVVLYMLCTIVAILPFAIYRFVIGDYLVGLIDTGIMLAMAGTVVFAWKSNNSNYAGMLTSAVTSTMTVVVAIVLELEPTWAFGSLVANFLLAPRAFALVASTAILVALGLSESIFDGPMERYTFLAVASMVALFSLIFASRVDSQHDQLVALARLDPLTQVGNRRALEAALLSLSNRAGGPAHACSLVVLDIDHFKQVNDRFGHDAGDQVLIDLTELLQTTLRRGDRLFRVGGEEFVIVLPGTDAGSLAVVLSKLLGAVRAGLRGPGGAVTASLGGAALRPNEGWDEALVRADRAMYEAKQSRDAWTIDDSASGEPVDRSA